MRVLENSNILLKTKQIKTDRLTMPESPETNRSIQQSEHAIYIQNRLCIKFKMCIGLISYESRCGRMVFGCEEVPPQVFFLPVALQRSASGPFPEPPSEVYVAARPPAPS